MGSGSWYVEAAPLALAAGVWTHVAWTYDQNAMMLYFNGQPVATNVIGPQPIATSSSNLRISGDDNGNVMFDGLIDAVSIYNRALSSNEIAAIYGAGAAGKCLSTAPAITGQPLSQTVVLGDTVAFSVMTTGLLPLTNQWELNASNLTDNGRITGSQSNALTITNVQFADAGSYTVMVTNVAGGTISLPATLVVLRKMPAITWANAAPITYGAAVNDVATQRLGQRARNLRLHAARRHGPGRRLLPPLRRFHPQRRGGLQQRDHLCKFDGIATRR